MKDLGSVGSVSKAVELLGANDFMDFHRRRLRIFPRRLCTDFHSESGFAVKPTQSGIWCRPFFGAVISTKAACFTTSRFVLQSIEALIAASSIGFV